MTDRELRLREALAKLVDAAETFASSDPDMPSHSETEVAFDEAIDLAKMVLEDTKTH